MSNFAIRVESVSKQYQIGQAEQQTTLGEALTSAARHPLKRLQSLAGSWSGQASRTIWALQDVSFEVRHGEVIGIIGRNGAGKSTMLKILSHITAPTRGRVELYGRVGSLLEVGTGFHPELTGRENIYLNGAILGMKRAEIRRKFDEIVAFAEIDKFLDTPVKRYSSGMYVRLAFAVAAHLEPEILIIDEVLAVGDASFQKKCLNKMEGVSQEGRTVLFVSHSMPAITRLCKRAVLLHEGRLLQDAPSHQVVSAYLSSGTGTSAERTWPDPATAPQGEIARLCAIRVRNEQSQIIDTVDIRHPVRVEMEYEVLKDGYVLMPNFPFFTEEGVHAFSAHDVDPAWRRRPRPRGRYISTVLIPGNLLSEGTIFVGAGLEALDPYIQQFYEYDVVAFHVVDSLDGDSARGDYVGDMHGLVRPLLQWSTQFSPVGTDHA
jgi:lipopolysaccharide transport system ATP-binding protein